MVNEDPVTRYIKTQRGHGATSISNPENESVYQGLWDAFCRVMSEALDRPVGADLRIVRSLYARAETVMTDGQVTVIYDEHLGSIFSSLTHLINTVDVTQSQAYLQLLFAQRMLIAGREEEAYLLAGGLDPDAAGLASGQLGNRSASEVLAQESFVLAHELAHYLFSIATDDGIELERVYRTFAEEGARIADLENLSEASRGGAATAAAFADSRLAEKIAESLLPGSGSVDPNSDESRLYWLSMFEAFLQPPSNLRVLQQSLDKPILREELVCDGLAVLQVLAQAEALGINADQLLRSIHIGLRNVGLLRYMDLLAVKGEALSDGERMSFIEETHVRAQLHHPLSKVARAQFVPAHVWRKEVPNLAMDETYRLVEQAFNVAIGRYVYDDDEYQRILASIAFASGRQSRSQVLQAEASRSMALYLETFGLLAPRSRNGES